MSCTPDYNKNKRITKREDGTLRIAHMAKVAEGRPRTEQSHKGECDIKAIIRRYKREGKPFPTDNPENYKNVVGVPNYLEMSLAVARANSAFESLPSKTRERFANDPHLFMEFINDPKTNGEEMIKMGLAVRNEAKEAEAKAKAEKSQPKAKEPAKKPEKTAAGTPDAGQPKGGSPEDSDQ